MQPTCISPEFSVLAPDDIGCISGEAPGPPATMTFAKIGSKRDLVGGDDIGCLRRLGARTLWRAMRLVGLGGKPVRVGGDDIGCMRRQGVRTLRRR